MKISWSEWWDTYRYNKSGAKYVVKNGLVAKAKFRICPEKVPDEDGNWVEYTQKHAYNDSRVGFYMTTLYNNEDGWEELKDTMETSPVWEEVIVPETPAPMIRPCR